MEALERLVGLEVVGASVVSLMLAAVLSLGCIELVVLATTMPSEIQFEVLFRK